MEGYTQQYKILWQQVYALTSANLKSRYRKTAAGFLWVILNPVLNYGVQAWVFSQILKVSLDNYPLYLLSGLVPWIFIVSSLEMCTSLYVQSGRLIKAYPMNPTVLILSQLLDNTFNFAAAFFILLAIVYANHPGQAAWLFLLPIPTLLLFIGTFGMVWMLSIMHVFFRDTRFIVSFGIGLLYFITPIFYPASLVPENLKWVIQINPINALIEPFRVVVYSFDLKNFGAALSHAAITAGTFLLAAHLIWRKKQNDVYNQV